MTRHEPANTLAWRSVTAVVLLVAGLGFIAWSFIVANVSTGHAAWSQEQAREYQAASSKLHSLSHEFALAAQSGNEPTVRDELRRAKSEYDELRGQLEIAMARPGRIAFWLRFAGLLLIAVGAVGLYWVRPGYPGPDF